MLGKLFKYEWRSISKLLLPIHGFVLLFALLSRFYFTISGGTDALLNTDSTIIGTLTMLLIFALVIVISSIAIFTYIYSGYHFHKNVFTSHPAYGNQNNIKDKSCNQNWIKKSFKGVVIAVNIHPHNCSAAEVSPDYKLD